MKLNKSTKAKLAVLVVLGGMALSSLACSDSDMQGNNASVTIGQNVQVIGNAQAAYDSAVNGATDAFGTSVVNSPAGQAGQVLSGK